MKSSQHKHLAGRRGRRPFKWQPMMAKNVHKLRFPALKVEP